MSKKNTHTKKTRGAYQLQVLNDKFTKYLMQYNIALEFNVKINLFRHTLNERLPHFWGVL